MGKRRRSREYVLQILYQLDITNFNVKKVLDTFWQCHTSTDEIRSFAEDLVFGVVSKQEKIDAIIRRYSEHWVMERMSIIDRNIMRCAVFELLERKDIPYRVTINEAVEIAGRFGNEGSSQFVNGILDRIYSEEKGVKDSKISAPPDRV